MTFKKLFILALTLASTSYAALAEVHPKTINIGVANAGVGGRPNIGGYPLATVHARQVLENAFKDQGTEIKWTFLPTAGPGVNEGLSNNLYDVIWQGDLPNIIGKSAGLDTKFVIADGRAGHIQIVARPGIGINSVSDLRGKKVALFKGTCLQLSANRILADAGLTERDLRLINMDTASANAAIASGDIDALFTLAAVSLPLRDRGLGQIIYDGKNDNGKHGCGLGISVTRNFAEKYPESTQKLVTELLRDRLWSVNPANRDEQYRLWTRSGYSLKNYREDLDGVDLRHRFSPLLDDEFRTVYQKAIEDSTRYKLVRRSVDINSWFDESYLNKAFQELGLDPADWYKQ